MATSNPRDPSTCANYESVTVEHYDLDWTVDLEKKQFKAKIDIRLAALEDADHVSFDVRDLVIDSISFNGQPAKYTVTENGDLGQQLRVEAELKQGDKPVISVAYSTCPKGAKAIQILTPEQTADKKAPFLFSQCQAILARSLMPCMDTPSVKSTYTGRVRVPAGLTVLMSAVRNGEKQVGEWTETEFVQSVPIASYLLAIVVGRLEKRKISDRCDVWAEPSIVDSALHEFEETEKFLETAEKIAGKG
ncbi:hypothetical protein WR25_07008 [Diploscapter pachys]|uniref:Aminopeptidase N-like N-terminal domain-containing protein n=1 Tax=Diploscapter pachys TaxID=2018661 RepID=A0A2A2LH30_9BILA|nr:hypothetical protein WR25_07008 [Diploscapter pachys]